MNIITRRQFLASSAACGLASAAPFLIVRPAAWAASPTILRAESRVIEVGGRAAKVFGLAGEDGKQGLALQAGQGFRVRLENALEEPTLVHWHGLTPPFGQDGVPDLPQPLLKPGEGFDYAFPLDTPGTHWMHAHTLQEQQLLAAPLIVADPADAGLDEQEVVVLLQGYVWTLNGKLWGEHRPLAVRAGERVELVMRNDSMMGHPMHLHGHHFQVVAINGRRIRGARRDTVWLPPQSEVTVAFDASNPGTWAFHCHHLYHMATGMMTVVEYA